MRDQQRLEEFGTGPNTRAVALFSEELFLMQVLFSIHFFLPSQGSFSVQKSSSSFGNLLGSSKAGVYKSRLVSFQKHHIALLHNMLLQDASFQEEDLEGRFLRSYSWLQDKTQKDLAGSSIDLKCKAFYESSVYRTVRGNSNGTFVLSNQTFPLFAK